MKVGSSKWGAEISLSTYCMPYYTVPARFYRNSDSIIRYSSVVIHSRTSYLEAEVNSKD
jgi:hypothetical protein